MSFLQVSVLRLNENIKGHYQDCVSNSGIKATNGDNACEQHKLFNMNLKTVLSRTKIIRKSFSNIFFIGANNFWFLKTWVLTSRHF